MPDANKLTVLKEQQYHVLTTCAVCVHGQFVPGSMWGSCHKMMYQHLRHSGVKPVSIYLAGTCPKAEIRADAKTSLVHSGFDSFILPGSTR